jgi:valyl-tRNA synthetase
LVGKKVTLPIYNREVPIITDKEVDMEFGTGATYLCTYGDEQDIRWQKRHKLKPISIINDDGTLNENAGFAKGMKIEDARSAMIEKLEGLNLITKTEPLTHNVLSHVERSTCLSPLELVQKKQWFIKVTDFIDEIKKDAKVLKWYPKSAMKRLTDWADSLDWDWIISRQRTFGTPIPFWSCEKCDKVLAAEKEDLPIDPRGSEKGCNCGGKMVGEQSVCDCWIDSSVSPLKVSKYDEDPKFFKKIYPTSLRPQGYEIIRTWAFYTLFRSKVLTGKVPWDDVVIHGMVGGTDGRKMSKSFGNVIEPEEVLDKYGADAVRQWCAGASGSDDHPLSWSEMEHSRKFMTKLWNISRFISMHKPTEEKPSYSFADKWIKNELNQLIEKVTKALDSYEYPIVKEIRNFVWHVFADHYIEMIKYRLYGENGSEKQGAIESCRYVLEKLLRLLAPFTPFITEELNESVFGGGSVHLKKWPTSGKFDKDLHKEGELLCKLVSSMRTFKMENQVGQGKELESVSIKGDIKILEKIKDDLKGTGRVRNLVLKPGKDSFEAKL